MASLHFLILTFTIAFPLTKPTSSLQAPSPGPHWIKPYIIDYRNGTVIRDVITEPPSFFPPPNNPHIQSTDITITTSSPEPLRARLFLPARPNPTQKLPVLVYFHGGAFCIGSPFSKPDTRFLARLTASSHILTVAVDYRLYPDVRIPYPYEEAWDALNWVASHRPGGPGSNPWLTQYGDFHRLYAGGDSAGGNIVHNLAIRVGFNPLPHGSKLTGVILAMPYFLGSRRVPLEPATITKSPNYEIWGYVCPNCKSGVDNPYINPFAFGAPDLAGLGCERLLVYTAELDELRGRGRLYYQKVKGCGWKGEARWVEATGRGHVFHILDPEDPATARLIRDFSAFLNA